MSRTLRPSPAATMQVTTKTRTASFDALSRNSLTFSLWLPPPFQESDPPTPW